ncbi:hypothetical protein [Mesorhizobium escarrei]|nr:hypothetical protein [Mesorhizobium escarrei]
MRLWVVSVACLMIASPSHAEDDISGQAETIWSAFHCAALATWMDDSPARERLFGIALREGRKFYKAMQDGRSLPLDLMLSLPSPIVDSSIGVVSPDFSLGQVWTGAVNEARRSIGQKHFASDGSRKIAAASLYEQNDCLLVH